MNNGLREKIRRHPCAEWYDQAKFGIMVHWSLFSVPAYAYCSGKTLHELAEKDGSGSANSMKYTPYAEWYQNALRIPGSPVEKHHQETYGLEFSYADFQPIFEKEAMKANMAQWADLFQKAGAKYVVLVTKHHDGYCLWPSHVRNPQRENYFSKRDFVGELTRAVRARGMKMGLYYSGIFDWTFKTFPLDNMEGWIRQSLVTDTYAKYATDQIYELIERYQPDILWNDLGYPAQTDIYEIFDHYYSQVPDGVINDRWRQISVPEENREAEIVRMAQQMEQAMVSNGLSGTLGCDCHRDFCTVEYRNVDKVLPYKWEEVRGVGMSFGYNAEEPEEHMLQPAAAIEMLADIISKNGNLLLNVGPMVDGTIPEPQIKVLEAIGAWLQTNGEAVYGTRPWSRPSCKTKEGMEVRFTSTGDSLYAIVLTAQLPQNLVLQGVEINSRSVSLLGSHVVVTADASDGNTVLTLPQVWDSQPAYVLKFTKGTEPFTVSK